MPEGRRSKALEDLDARLRAAREHSNQAAGGESDTGKRGKEQGGIAFALRVGIDFVSALAVGVGIGLLLDYWLETKPWFLILFFLLGAAAGFLSLYRAVSGYGLAAGYRKAGDAGKSDAKEDTAVRDDDARDDEAG